MRKLKNNKGFTLIELLAVIVILAILVAVAVPAVTRYLNTARQGTYASNANAALSVVRNDVIAKGITTKKPYTLTEINALLDKKLVESPYGKKYTTTSYIMVDFDSKTLEPLYYICLMDEGGNGLYDKTKNAVAEANAKEINVQTGLATDKATADALCNTANWKK